MNFAQIEKIYALRADIGRNLAARQCQRTPFAQESRLSKFVAASCADFSPRVPFFFREA
jgi:hypothetical protein